MAINNDGSLSKLEFQSAEIKAKAKDLGYGGALQYYSILGGESPVKLNAKTTFAFKVQEGIDPLYHATFAKSYFQKEKKRGKAAKVTGLAAFGAGGKNVQEKDPVEIEFTKISAGVYNVIPSRRLEPIEYAFIIAGSTSGTRTNLYCFGVK